MRSASPRSTTSRATGSSSRCSTAYGPVSSRISRRAATTCSSPRRTARSGTRTSCAASASGRRTSCSSSATSSAADAVEHGVRVRGDAAETRIDGGPPPCLRGRDDEDEAGVRDRVPAAAGEPLEIEVLVGAVECVDRVVDPYPAAGKRHLLTEDGIGEDGPAVACSEAREARRPWVGRAVREQRDGEEREYGRDGGYQPRARRAEAETSGGGIRADEQEPDTGASR